MSSNNESSVDQFLATSRMAKTRVGVIVPLYGYWKDINEADRQLDIDSLRTTLNRVHSMLHQVYFFFVAEPNRLPKDIQNELVVRNAGGNVKFIPIEEGNSYADYIRTGMEAALDKQYDIQFLVNINPWVITQHLGLDTLIERLNMADNAKIVSGFDIKELITNDADKLSDEFDNFKPNVPKENFALTFNFVGMTRASAELLRPDTQFKTHEYIEKDTWTTMRKLGFNVITSQRIPIYPFDIDWSLIEPRASREEDKDKFISKWHYDLE